MKNTPHTKICAMKIRSTQLHSQATSLCDGDPQFLRLRADRLWAKAKQLLADNDHLTIIARKTQHA
jgi:hypothetical protein